MVEFDHHWDREYSFYYGVAVLYGLKRCLKDALGIDATVRGEGINGWFRTYSEKGTKEGLMKCFLEKCKHNPDFVRNEIQRLHKHGQHFVDFAKRVELPQDTPGLIKHYQEFFALYCEFGNDLWKSFYLVEAASNLFEKFLCETFPHDKINEAIEQLSFPIAKAAVLLISDYFRKEKDIEKKAAFIERDYPWLGSKDLFIEPMTREDIRAYATAFTAPNKKIKRGFDHPSVQLYQEMLFVKDKRDEYRREAFYYAFPLVRELSRRLNIPVSDLGYALPEELDAPDLLERIRKRKEGYILTLRNKLDIVVGKEIMREFLRLEQTTDADSLLGRVGCPGVIRGRVQLIRTKEDIKNFKEGNVLVAVTTDPQHIVAMHKACAFVTDEGGITCHAAIVAREMGKPCVVGTGCATKVLKDGDVVEVDARNGIVRKLK